MRTISIQNLLRSHKFSLLRISLAFIALLPISNFASEQSIAKLTLHDLLSYGLQNSPAIAAANSDLITAQYKVSQQKNFFWPQADLNIEYADVNDFNVVEDGEITGQRSRLRSDNIVIKQNIYNAVQISQWRKSKLEYDYASVQHKLATENLFSDIMRLFIDFHSQQVSLELLNNKNQYLLKQRELLQLKNDTGSGSAIELLRLEQSISTLDIELYEAEFALANTILDIGDIIGLSSKHFDLQPLNYTDDLNVLWTSTAIGQQNNLDVVQSLEIRDLYFKSKLAEYDLIIATNARWPSFYLEYQYDQTDVPGQDDERSISMNMSWNLFDGWNSHYRRLESLERYRFAQQQYDEGLRRLERKLTKLQREIEAGIKLYAMSISTIVSSKTIITLTEMGADYGSKNALDVMQAVNDYFNARQTQFELFAEILRDLIELWKIGNNLNHSRLQRLSEVLYAY